MLELKNLVFEVPADDGGTKRIIDDLSLTIPGWQEKIPFDLYLLVDGTIIALLCVAVEEVYSYVSFYTCLLYTSRCV